MKVLVIGSGGREHALAWKLAASPKVQKVYVAPGNGGTARDARLQNVAGAGVQARADFAQAERVALTVVGPEGPLAEGVVDAFRARGLRIFGPTRAAAQLESSKAYAKDFMQRHGVPTARYAVFTDAAAAHAHVDRHGAPIVVKADGLAAGKGVVVAATAGEAHAAIDAMLGGAGGAGGAGGTDGAGSTDSAGGADSAAQPADVRGVPRVVIEEFLEGEEASFIVLSDGRHVLPLAASQDHKRLHDGDRGPNTGGMGAYSPAPVVTPNVHATVMHEIIQPTIAGMARDGTPFTGFLYAGLMIDAQGRAKTLEFNTRLGDPEAQPLLMRLKSDLYEVLVQATAGTLDSVQLQWDRRVALGVVMAAAGYPAAPRRGDAIDGLPPDGDDLMAFHAGTALDAGGRLVTAGGRVLCVTALADSVKLAQQRAHEAIAGIRFDGAHYRHDIGHRAFRRPPPAGAAS
jgi:phosphoribosylamine--glycine ligase